MLNDRFDELSRKPDAPFLSAGAHGGGLTPTVETVSLGAGVQDGKIEAGLAALAIEAKRVREHGFGAGGARSREEMDARRLRPRVHRARQDRERLATSRNTSITSSKVSRAPGIAYEHQLAHAAIPAITADRRERRCQGAVFARTSRVILAVSPQKANVPVPTDVQLKAALAATDAVAVTAWNDTAMGTTLMEHVPEPAAVTSRREIPELGVTVVRFANGVEAWFKPTDFKNDQVLFSLARIRRHVAGRPGQVPRGAAGDRRWSASPASAGTAPSSCRSCCAGKIAGASPFFTLSTQGISGSSTPANLETGLQLLNLNFTAPGDDPEAFGLIKRQLEAAYANRDSNPNALFGEKLSAVNTMDHYTSRPLTLDADRQARSRRDGVVLSRRGSRTPPTSRSSWSAPSSWTRRCRSSRATSGRCRRPAPPSSRFKDVGITFPASNREGHRRKGARAEGHDGPELLRRSRRSRRTSRGESKPRPTVLEIALRDILREELGETYSVSVGLSQRLPQIDRRIDRHQLRVRARERRQDGRARAAGGPAAAG